MSRKNVASLDKYSIFPNPPFKDRISILININKLKYVQSDKIILLLKTQRALHLDICVN